MFEYFLKPTEKNLRQFYYGFFIGWVLVLFFGFNGFLMGLMLSAVWNIVVPMFFTKQPIDLKATISYTAPIVLIWLLGFLQNLL